MTESAGRLPRPLDPIRSIKLKLGAVIGISGLVGFSYFWWVLGWIPVVTSMSAILLGLVTSQLLAHGMTRPLREMTAAARAMAAGDYSRRVTTTTRDEVGQLAAAFNRMAADLGAADQRRRELIGNVAHELRTPISALQAVLENVVDGVAEPDERLLGAALTQTQRLGRLVTELLDLSRIDAGVSGLAREPFPIAPMIADAVGEAGVAATAAGRSVRFDVVVDPPDAVVVADRERLYEVVLNLLDNAVRHGPTTGTVRIEATRSTTGTRLDVADEGPGIPAAERDRIFERFTRGERATGSGTGLGLAICRWVVDLHGGRIELVPSQLGCRIRVTLPD